MVATISAVVKPEITSDIRVSDIWVKASWDEFIAFADEPSLEKGTYDK